MPSPFEFSPPPLPLRWTEGLLLSPQHLQQSDIYWERQIAHRGLLLQPYFWGLVDLRCQLDQLASGKVVIERLHAVLPDGLIVMFDSAVDGAPLACDLAAARHDFDAAPRLRVWLQVPLRFDGSATVESRNQRFKEIDRARKLDERRDENLGGSAPVWVERQSPRLSIVVADQPTPGHSAMRLLDIELSPEGHYRLADYHPPLLRIGAAAFLDKDVGPRMEKLAAEIRGRISELAAGRSSDEEIEALDRRGQRALRACIALAAALPPFEVLLRSRVAHPFDLYLAIAALSGQLSCVVGWPDLQQRLNDYDHDDCYPGFLRALEHLEAQLDRVKTDDRVERFERDAGRPWRFSLKLPRDLAADELLVEVRPAFGQRPEALLAWMRDAKIGDERRMESLQRGRQAGAERRAIGGGTQRDPGRPLPADLRLVEGAVLFTLTAQAADRAAAGPLFEAGQVLVVEGPERSEPPRELRLHRPIGAGGGGDARR